MPAPDVWVTRARPGAEATAARLRERGRQPLVAPLLEVRMLDVRLDLAGAGALAFTSANAVEAAGAGALHLPVFTVGDATADVARRAGLSRVESASGDVAALAALIVLRRESFEGAVLHPAAAEPAGNLVALLAHAGVRARTVAAYETLPAEPSAAARAAWPGLAAVLLHSPKAARRLVEATAGWPLSEARVLCLSDAVAQALGGDRLRATVAARPDEDALLNLLDVT